jgi:glyoxylase-like metal-dependent hydrolase (beta-lactamase superfamily II)
LSDVTKLDDDLWLLDLDFQGLPGVIASYLIRDADELALVETGPTTTLEALVAGIRRAGFHPEQITKLLVTHIHLDHSGAAGVFMKRFPRAQLYVHEIGAPHMVDPSKLLASATRIYGDMMGPLWGEVLPVSEDRVIRLTDGDVVSVGDKNLEVLYTPGHALHHVAYYDASTRGVFTGDVASVRLQGFTYVRPPTPPPDLNIDLWRESLDRLRRLAAATLYLTHFGPFTDVERHLADAERHLVEWARIVEKAVESGKDRPAIVDNLRLFGDRQLLQETNDAIALRRYELATPYGMTVDGLLRYLRKRAPQSPP